MGEPITEPGERTRRELQASLDSKDAELSRKNMALSLIGIEYAIKEISATLTRHIDDDKSIQGDLKVAVQDLTSKVGAVSSSVTTDQINSRYTLGQVAAGFIILCAAIGGLTEFIAWAIGHAVGAKP